MGSSRLLTEMFISEATLEFPDSEIAAVTRMIQSNERAGRIPRGATENWPIVQGGRAGASTPGPAKPTVKAKPTAKASASGGDLSGRGVPSQSSLRSGEPSQGLSHEPPSGLKKYTRPDAGKKAKPKDKDAKADGGGDGTHSLLKRAYSKARGRDPENGLPLPKSATSKVYGGQASSTPRPFNAPPERFVGQKSEDEPLFNVPGVTGAQEPDDGDEKVAVIRKGLSAAKPNLPPRQAPSFPEPNVWDRFAGSVGDEPPTQAKSYQQGRLSRLFKGRRDNGI
jgi:hypothetical protein